MVDGRNRDFDHQGPATGRPRACADHALACIRKPHAAGRACDHKLSQELAVGKEQSSWALWSEREANLIRDEDRSGCGRNTGRSGAEMTAPLGGHAAGRAIMRGATAAGDIIEPD